MGWHALPHGRPCARGRPCSPSAVEYPGAPLMATVAKASVRDHEGDEHDHCDEEKGQGQSDPPDDQARRREPFATLRAF